MEKLLFRAAIFILLMNAFLLYPNLPDKGLFRAKELHLWFSASTICLFVVIQISVVTISKIQISYADIFVCVLLIVLPCLFRLSNMLENPNIFINYLALGACYLGLRVLSSRLRKIFIVNTTVQIMVLVLLIQLCVAWSQHFQLIPIFYPGSDATGMFYNPGPFAIYTAILTTVAVILLAHSISSRRYALIFFYSLIVASGIFFISGSLSRSSWFGLLCGSFVGLFVYFRYWMNLLAVIINARIKVFIAVFFFAFSALAYLSSQFKNESASGRLLIWNVSSNILKAHWVTGVGYGNFAVNYLDCQAKFLSSHQRELMKFQDIAGDVCYAFNDVLQIFIEGGFIGVACFLSIILITIKIAFTNHGVPGRAQSQILLKAFCIGGVTTILISGMSSYPLAILPIAILFWLLIASIVSISSPDIVINDLKYLKCFSWLILVAGMILLNISIRKLDAYVRWVDIKSSTLKHSTQLLGIYVEMKNDPDYLEEISDVFISEGDYRKAIFHLQRATQISSYRDLHYKIGMCYEKIGEYGAALTHYQLIRNAMPKLMRPRYQIAKLYHSTKNYKMFKSAAEDAIEFDYPIYSSEVVTMKKELVQLLNLQQ